ncbi:MAG: TRAP transporter fused permease subunit [Hyphomicrobiales bacterium]|nr:TRAP transporter fused permease subunit [Hyphomicrobiales bacterium]
MENAQGEGEQRFRQLKGLPGALAGLLLILLAAIGIGYTLQLHLYLDFLVLEVQYLGALLALALASIFLLVPHRPGASRERVPWFDYGLAVLGLVVGGYVAWHYPVILMRPGMTPLNVGLGVIAVGLLFEAARRSLGWALVLFALASMALAFWGHLIGISVIEFSWQRWFYFFYLDENGIFGNILGLLATVVFAFVVFGQVLTYAGGSDAIIDLTKALVGRYTGGPAKAAVLASGMMGSITGSIAVNAVTTGTITIPLMKRNGYPPAFAAGVECAASTGGPLLPPVMGITAFLMAEFLGIPYFEVALAASLPALLYFIIIYVQVHCEAVRSGLRGLPASELPPRGKSALAALPFMVPLSVIIFFLFVLRYSAERAALYGAAAAILVGLLFAAARRRFARVDRLLMDIARSFLVLAVTGSLAGVIVSSLVLSGIGPTFVSGIRDLAGDSLILMLILAAIVNLILGLGLPAIVTYIVLAVLVAPTMIQFGVPPLAAHLFTLYFAVAAELTPPAGAPIFITMSIAQASFMRTAMEGLRLAAGVFLLPFVFVYHPGLLLLGSGLQIALDFLVALAGLVAVSFGLRGVITRRIGYVARAVLLLVGGALLFPDWQVKLAGAFVLVTACGLIYWQQFSSLRRRLDEGR